jgi:hypothetical protein
MGQQIVTSSSDSIVSLPVTADVVAGDYFYEWGNGSSGWPKPATVSFGQTRVVAGANRTLEAGTSPSRACSNGPLIDTTIYTGSTITANTITTASSSLQAFAGFQAKVATLTNGNFVSVYMSAANTLSAKVFNPSGTQVGSTATLSTTVSSASASYFAGLGTFDVAGLSTGGYVVIFKHQTLNYIHIVTVSSAGAVSAAVAINSSFRDTACTPMSIVGDSVGGYLMAYARSTTDVSAVLYNSTNTFVGGTSTVSGWASYFNGGVSNLFPIAFVLNNGVMGVATNIYGTDACTGQLGNITVVTSLSASAGGVSGRTVVNGQSYTSAGFYGCAVAPSSVTPSYAMVLTCTDQTNIMRPIVFSIPSVGSSPSVINTGSITTSLRNQKPEIIANADGTFTAIWKDSAGVTKRQDVSAAAVNIGTAVTIDTTTTLNYVSACPLAYKAAVAMTPTATNFPSQFIIQTESLTNGQTFTSTTPYSPISGYYLKGIALETVSAGGTCKVGVKGQFALGAGYLPWTASFDYVGTARSGVNMIKGNSGSVTTTNVTLQGLK